MSIECVDWLHVSCVLHKVVVAVGGGAIHMRYNHTID